jgi:hypothetical protein
MGASREDGRDFLRFLEFRSTSKAYLKSLKKSTFLPPCKSKDFCGLGVCGRRTIFFFGPSGLNLALNVTDEKKRN